MGARLSRRVRIGYSVSYAALQRLGVMDESDGRRDALHAFLQEQGPDIDKAAVLVGWAIVCDWSDTDGDRWIAKAHSASIPSWHADGLHHQALRGDWPDDEDD